MADYFKQMSQAAERAGAGPALDYAKEQAMKGAAGLAGAGIAESLGYSPEVAMEQIRQESRAIDEGYIEPVKEAIAPYLPPGVSVDMDPRLNLGESTVTPRFDLSVLDPNLQGQAYGQFGQGGLQDYGVNASYQVAPGLLAQGSYQAGGVPRVGMSYEQPMLGGLLQANVGTELTNDVRDTIRGIQASLRFTGRF